MDKFRVAYWFQEKQRIRDQYDMRLDRVWAEHDEAVRRFEQAGVSAEQLNALGAAFDERQGILWTEYAFGLAKAWLELTNGKS